VAITNGSGGLRALYLAQSARARGPLAAVDASGAIVVADPAMAEVLAGPIGDDAVAALVARLAVALGDGPAITIRPVHRGGTVRGALVGTLDPARAETPSLTRLVGLHGDHSVLLAPGEVRLAEADGATVWLSTERGRLRCAERGLTRLEERLREHGFLRVHRHYLVNLRRVREIAPTFRGGIVLVLDGPDRPAVPVSRRRSAEVRAQLCL
jgi:DNA-binding LytR/AlgR family response regulator